MTITALLLVAAGTVAIRTTPPSLALVGRPALADVASAPTTTTTTAPAAALQGPLSNPKSLDAALAASGYKVPPGANVYAAKVTSAPAGLTYDDYQAGGGALGQAFWPASSIKILAAVGALEFIGGMGFSGAATVKFAGSGSTRTVQSIYDAALRVSSNGDYDLLVEIAGVDWLNQTFLTPARGFPVTVIQRSYNGGDLYHTPAMTLTEGGRSVTVPARTSSVDTSCAQGNCSDLFEMSESLRRVVLNNEISPAERFHLTPADVAGMTASLLAAEGWIEPAILQVVGNAARVYSKPGYVPNRDCMDITFTDAKGLRLLLSATVPDAQGGCDALITLATGVTRLLSK